MQAGDLITDGGVTWKIIDTRKLNITVYNATGNDSLNPMSQAAVTNELNTLQRQMNSVPPSVGTRLDSIEGALSGAGISELAASANASIQSAVNAANASIQTALNNLDTNQLWTTDRMWIE